MSLDVEIKKSDYLYVKVKGKRTVDSIKQATKQIAEECKKYKYSKALVDVRDFTERISFSEIFDLASIELSEIINERLYKVAIVDVKGFDTNKQFFEDVAINRGHNVKIFTDTDSAIQWLS